MSHLTVQAEDPARVRAREAGAKGVHAKPMTNLFRRSHYERENAGRPLTPAQCRRLVKHSRQVAKRLRGDA